MRDILFDYELNATTWAYLSALMTIGIYFKFRRLFSIRNLDLIGLIAFSPGLLLVFYGLRNESKSLEQYGYEWLFCVAGLFLIRLLLDTSFVRRPILEPNLSASGLFFTGSALLVFLFANVITSVPAESDLKAVQRLEHILALKETPPKDEELTRYGPGYPLFYFFARLTSEAINPADWESPEDREAMVRVITARLTAILGHLAVVIGMVLIGYRHFDDVHAGVAMASLYLLLPYTAQLTGRVDHVIPAALLVWAVEAYRRPVVSGILLGLATGVIYYPLFLLPLWCAFYWKRGLFRFLIAFAVVLLLLVASLAFNSSDFPAFWEKLQQMFGWTSLIEAKEAGFWQFYPTAYRIPVFVAWAALACSMAVWPPHRDLGALLACSAAVMLAAHFWDPRTSGLCMAWYLPLLIMTIFRPNLEDRVAIKTVSDIRWRRKSRPLVGAAG